jgi:hypothetical protein
MPDSSPHIVLVEHAGEHIPVAVEFRERDHLSISVHPDGSVTALAPASCSLEEVLAHLNRRRLWIVRQRRHFEKFQPLPVEKRYVPGETHLYLGRQYRLRVQEAETPSVRLKGKFFEVYVPILKQPQAVAAAMNQWYQSHAKLIFKERMRRYVQLASPLRLSMEVKLRVNPMARRWGSCSKGGTITLNTGLVKAPLHCIDYVIMHELCHLKIHDHSPAFFRMLGRCMPDWQRRKERLELMVMR